MSRAARVCLSLLRACALSFAVTATATAAATNQYAGRKDVRQFIVQMAEKHGFDEKELRTLFSHARFQPDIIAASVSMRWYLACSAVSAGRARVAAALI